MIFALFTLFAMNLILRLNDFIPGFEGFPLAEICIPILLLIWLLFGKKDFSLLPDLLIPGFFLFAVTGFALKVWPGGTYMLAREFAPWVAMYFLAANLVNTRRRMDWFLAALYIVTLVLAAHCLQQVWNFNGIDDATGVGWAGATVYKGRVRYVGVMNDPNDLALFFSMMLAVPLMLAGRAMRRSFQVLGFLLCIPLLAGIYFTNSRGGLLATGCVAAVYLWRRWGPLQALAVCTVLGFAMLALGPSRIRAQDYSDEASTQGRIDAWYEGIQLLKQHPVFGVGKDQFVEHNYLTAHNSFVLCFAETGLPGYVLWLGALFMAGFAMHASIKRCRPDSHGWRQSVALFTSLCAFCVGGFFLSRTYFILLPVFIGLAIAQFRILREEARDAEFHGAVQPGASLWEGAPALPDLSWLNVATWLPRISCLAVLSIAFIYLVVKIKV